MARKTPKSDSSATSPQGGANHTSREEFLRQVLDINPNLIFAKDREGRFTLVNKALADTYGTTVEELIGKTDADFNPNPDQVAFFRAMDLLVMDSLKEEVIPEEVITDAEGVKHYLQTVKRPIVGPDGKANQVLGVATDITLRRELEEQLRQAQKMEAIGQLAGGIAHDFNNMLAVILGNTERLLSRVRRGDLGKPALIEGLELIQSAGTRAADLVSQILTFSRRQPTTPVVLNVGEVVSGMTDLLRTMIGPNITLTVHRRDTGVHVRIDRGRLEQVIVNLVVNARDAMAEGGKLVIETGSTELPTLARRGGLTPGQYVTLSVTDTGVGIPPELIERVFEPFFSTKAARGKGTGLGLSIVYSVVQQAGGQVTVESSQGNGACFRILLPATKQVPTADPEPPRTPEKSGSETILVCEDEPEVLKLIREILSDNGYKVLTARDGREALHAAAQHEGRISLLLTDVVMPGLTGPQLADALQRDNPRLKVLLISGYAEPGADQGIRKRNFPIIGKPFQSATLLEAVRRLLDGAQ